MQPIPTCPTPIEKVVGARTAISFSVAENAQTWARKKHLKGLRADESSGSARGTIPSKNCPLVTSSPAQRVSKLPAEAIESLLLDMSIEDTELSVLWLLIRLRLAGFGLSFEILENERDGFCDSRRQGAETELGAEETADPLSRTPEGPSSIPKAWADLIKYCIVVPVLRVWTALRSSKRFFKALGTYLHCEK